MFEGSGFSKSLDEELFEAWLEKGRKSKISYKYMLIIWDEQESSYRPVYLESRNDLNEFVNDKSSYSHEFLVAAYDLYSESRIL